MGTLKESIINLSETHNVPSLKLMNATKSRKSKLSSLLSESKQALQEQDIHEEDVYRCPNCSTKFAIIKWGDYDRNIMYLGCPVCKSSVDRYRR